LGGELVQAREHDVADVAGRAHQVELTHRLDTGQRGGAGDRVAAVCAAQPTGVDRVHDLRTPGDAGQRKAAGDRLRGGDEIGYDRLVIRGEPISGPAEASLDLVGDEQRAVMGGPAGQRGQEPGSGYDEATLALDRLDQDRCDVRGADLLLDDV